MSRPVTTATARVRAGLLALLGLVATALVTLTPTLAVDGSSAMTAAVVALLVTTLAAHGHPRRSLPLSARGTAPTASYDAWPSLRAFVTDPVHHPRRPRAPGTA